MKISATQSDVIEEASAWFIEFRSGDVTASDRTRFFEWLRRSPQHIQAYLEIAEGWAELPTADVQGQLDLNEILRLARDSRDDNVIPLGSRPALAGSRARRGWFLRAAAAAVSMVLLAGAIAWVALNDSSTYHTGVGERRTVRLEDGSVVELNALSRVRVHLSEDLRVIDLLSGQALFDVAKDEKRPFLVRSGTTTVRAVGTQFDVYRRRAGTVVTVVEGRVAVDRGGSAAFMTRKDAVAEEAVVLVAGEQLTVATQAASRGSLLDMPKPRVANVTAATAWVQEQLIFDETPLSEVAEEFNRYSTRKLVIADAQLGSLGVSGVFSSMKPDALLGFLRAQPGVNVRDEGGEITVTRAAK